MHKVITRRREPNHNQGTPKAAQRRAAKRERILSAGLKLFTHRRYQAVTMDRVAETAGVAKGTLYLYFRSKEALYMGLLRAGFDAWLQAYESRVEPGSDIATRLRRAIEGSIQFYDQHSYLFRAPAHESFSPDNAIQISHLDAHLPISTEEIVRANLSEKSH